MKQQKRFRFPTLDTVMNGTVVAAVFVLVAMVVVSPEFLNALA